MFGIVVRISGYMDGVTNRKIRFFIYWIAGRIEERVVYHFGFIK